MMQFIMFEVLCYANIVYTENPWFVAINRYIQVMLSFEQWFYCPIQTIFNICLTAGTL